MRKRTMFSVIAVTLALATSTAVIAAPQKSDFDRGVIAYRQNDITGSIAAFQKAIETNREDALAQSWLGFILLKQGNSAEAVAPLQKASTLSPKDPEVWNNLGTAYLNIGEAEKSVAAYREALKLRPSSADQLYNLGNAQLSLGKPADAEKTFRQAVASKPKDTSILNNLALSLQQQGKTQEAIATFKAALAIEPNSPSLLLNLGLAQKANRDYAAAQTTLDRATKASKDNYYARVALGEILAGQGKDNDAIAHYKVAASLRPDQFTPHYNLGILYANLGKHKLAVDEFTAAQKIKPADVDTMVNLGWSIYKTGQDDQGISTLKAAVALDGAFVEAHKHLAAAYMTKKDTLATVDSKSEYRDLAIGEWSQVTRLDAKDIVAHINLGNLYWEAKDISKASVEYRAAVALDPKSPQAKLGLGLALVKEGKLDEAISQYNSLINSDAGAKIIAAAYNNLGVAYEQKSESATGAEKSKLIDSARDSYTKALALDKDYKDALYNLGRLPKKS